MLTLNGIQGHLTLGDARVLLNAAARVPPYGLIVEIGSYKGLSASLFAQASHPTVQIHCIDPWASEPGNEYTDPDAVAGDRIHAEFVKNTRPWAHRIKARRATSQDESIHYDDRTVDLVWIDGSHTYDDVVADVTTWWARLKVGGTMLAHDCSPQSPAHDGVVAAATRTPGLALGGLIRPPCANFIFEAVKLPVPVPHLMFTVPEDEFEVDA